MELTNKKQCESVPANWKNLPMYRNLLYADLIFIVLLQPQLSVWDDEQPNNDHIAQYGSDLIW